MRTAEMNTIAVVLLYRKGTNLSVKNVRSRDAHVSLKLVRTKKKQVL